MKFHIFEDQLTSHQEIEEEIQSFKNDLQQCRAAKSNPEAEKWFEEMRNIFNSMAHEISNLKNTNSHREEYIKCFDKGEGLAYKGKTFFETKNKHRTLNAFLTRADRATWFSKAFGLELDSLKITEADHQLCSTANLCSTHNFSISSDEGLTLETSD